MVRQHVVAWTGVRYLILSVLLVVMVFPLLWMFRVAFLPASVSVESLNWFANSYTLSNFVDLFANGTILRPLVNSIVIGMVVTATNVLFCFMAGYALARYRNLVSKMAFASCLMVLMIPAHVTVIPLYLMAIKGGWYDSYLALIIPWMVTPLGVFLVRQYVQGIPASMEEAARVDGASELGIVYRIVMPMCRPVLVVLAIQVFVTNWNSFLYPFILTSRESLRTLPVALAMLQGHQAIDWQHLMAGSALAVAPVLVVFFVLQRHILSGIMAGGVKQ